MEKIEDIKVLVYNISSIKTSALICFFLFIFITTLMKFSFLKWFYESWSGFSEMSINWNRHLLPIFNLRIEAIFIALLQFVSFLNAFCLNGMNIGTLLAHNNCLYM